MPMDKRKQMWALIRGRESAGNLTFFFSHTYIFTHYWLGSCSVRDSYTNYFRMLSNHTRRLSPAPGGEHGKLGHSTHKIHLIYSYSIHSYIGPSHHMYPLQLLKEDEHLQDVAHLKFIKLLIHDENNGCSWLELLGPNGFQGSLSLCVDFKWLLPTSQGYHKCLLDKSVFLLTGFPEVFYTDNGQNFF